MMFRQGDVLLIKVDELPADAKRIEAGPGRIVLAYGEATGHAHAIYETKGVWLMAAKEDRFLDVREPTALRHEEHAPISLDSGVYRVIDQYEHTPSEIRRVMD